MEYLLMNKDEKLLRFSVERKLGLEKITDCKILSKVLPIGFDNISVWVNNRNYAKHKSHFKKWLEEWGIDSIEGFINISHCLGLNDCFWVKPSDSSLRWDNVSLYQNEFSDIAQRTAFETGLCGLQLSSTNLTSPEFTIEGAAPKCWIKESNDIILYKAKFSGACNVGKEPYSEYMASLVSSQMIPSVKYNIEVFNKTLCSTCKLFTNEDIGFVPFYRVCKESISSVLDVIDVCSEMGFGEECKKMFLIDSIVFNQDRHLGNFGFLVDNDTQEIIGFAPLFDYNLSMLGNALDVELESYDSFKRYVKEYGVGHKLGADFLNLGIELAKEISIPKIRLGQHENYKMDEVRFRNLSDIFYKHLDMMNGKTNFF